MKNDRTILGEVSAYCSHCQTMTLHIDMDYQEIKVWEKPKNEE